MDISKMTNEEILAELNKREAVPIVENEVLVFGSIGIDGGTNFVEVFKKIKTPEDLDFLTNYSLRVRMNSQRNYKGFYFKTKEFKALEKNLNENNEKFAKWVRQNDSMKYMQL